MALGVGLASAPRDFLKLAALASDQPNMAASMKAALLAKLTAADKPFMRQ